jgi:hypothetical protein
MRASWRWSRQASTASSLPIVVGVAGWPWVWASSGTSRRSEAIVASASTSAVARGSQTSVTAPLTITAYDRLLTSSLVHAEVDELGQAAVCVIGRDLGEPLLHEVLDRLHVVLGDPLGGGHLVDLGRAERAHHLAQALDLGCRESPHARNHLTLGEVDEPLDLDVHAGPVQGRLTEVVDEGGDRPAVAPVERTERDRGLGVGERGRGGEAAHALSLPERRARARRCPGWRT